MSILITAIRKLFVRDFTSVLREPFHLSRLLSMAIKWWVESPWKGGANSFGVAGFNTVKGCRRQSGAGGVSISNTYRAAFCKTPFRGRQMAVGQADCVYHQRILHRICWMPK